MSAVSSTSSFGTINPFHENSFKPGNQEMMTEIAISDHQENNSKGRPATLPVESPFGTPGLSGVTLASSNKRDMKIDSRDMAGQVSPAAKTPMDAIKEWSLSTYKCTKQLVNEKLGKCPRTVDVSLENEIEKLRETQRKYSVILKGAGDMSSMYCSLVAQQAILYESLNELAMKESKSNAGTQPSSTSSNDGDNTPSSSTNHLNLGFDFRQNADMLKTVAKNGEKLILALKFFCCNLSTLVNKTIEDTITTIRAYEQARLEFDAEKNSTANLLPAQATNPANSEKLAFTKMRYERLRDDVGVKLKFLDENKAKVMHKQLILFHNAFTAYASGNNSALDSTLKQFSIKCTQQSWLEK